MTTLAPALAYLVSRYPAISHTFISREIAQLRNLGHFIRTASINPPDRALDCMDKAERHEASNTYCVKTHGVPGALSALSYWAVRAPRRLLGAIRLASRSANPGKGLAYAVEAAMVAKWMKNNELSHLHVHFGNAGASVGVLVKALTNCHLSYTIHGPDEFDDVLGQQLANKMAAADVVVCISQFARSQLMRISAPADWPKFKVCRLGVDPSQFTGSKTTLVKTDVNMLCVGRLTPAKGQVLLIQACARLRAAGIRFHMKLVGDGPDRQRVEATITEFGLQDFVTLTGSLTQEGVRHALSDADIFVLPSLAEGIPVVLMEAMCSSVPCISTPVNGIPELIEHNCTGLLATPGDVDSLVVQLLHLCGSREERERLARAASIKVRQHFDLISNVGQLSHIFSTFPGTSSSMTRISELARPMDLSIIIVTYNSATLIGKLLDQLHVEICNKAQLRLIEVVLVDNNSRDGTAELVGRRYPWVRLLASTKNLGFAAGNNLAARHANGEYLLLLNPDAIPAPGSIVRGIALMDAHPQVGIGGGELLDVAGVPQPSARMFPTLRDELFTMSGLAARFPQSKYFSRLDRRWADHEANAQVDWIPGAFVFIRAKVFEELSGFDERFFMYYEEVDLCRRLHAKGRTVQYWPALKAMHIGGASAKTVENARVSRKGSQLESWRMRSALLYYRKHHGIGGSTGLYLIELGWNRLRQLRSTLRGQHDKASDLKAHCLQMQQAWTETEGGQTSPAAPW